MKKRNSATATAKGRIIGRAAFARISAVEGIRLTPEMSADFDEFERKGIPAAARRKAILEKYGKAR